MAKCNYNGEIAQKDEIKKIKNSKTKWFCRVSIARSEKKVNSKNRQILKEGSQFLAINEKKVD
jgi:hypothetical protein